MTPDENGLLARWKLALHASADSRLSRGDIAVLMVILECMNKSGVAWPGLGKIAADASLDRSSVVRSVKRLADFGYLSRESGDRTTSNRYRMGVPTRCEIAPRCKSAPRCEIAPGVGANSYTEVGAAVHPEPTHKNLPNEPAHSAAVADASRPADPLWGTGLDFLIRKGTPAKQARSFLGKLCKQVGGEVQAIALLAQAEEADVIDPIAWLAKSAQSSKVLPLRGRLARDARSEDEITAALESELAKLGARA